MGQPRFGVFLPAAPTITRKRKEVTTPTQVRCFICQRITAGVFDGKKDAFEKAGVWFQNQES